MAETPKLTRCIDCKAWAPADGFGTCLRRAPQLSSHAPINASLNGCWPTTLPHEGCFDGISQE